LTRIAGNGLRNFCEVLRNFCCQFGFSFASTVGGIAAIRLDADQALGRFFSGTKSALEFQF